MEKEESLNCLQCEKLGEISYNTLQRDEIVPSINILNIPEGITRSGIKNLFLSIGDPNFIILSEARRRATVGLKTRKEIELAIRDLHKTPPYYLVVHVNNQKTENSFKNQQNDDPDFKPIYIDDLNNKKSVERLEDKNKEEKFRSLIPKIKSVDYDPSVRVRQKNLDYKTPYRCISFGRGYYYNENNEHIIGGLKSYSVSSSKSTINYQEINNCENCMSPTVKNCKICSKYFCSQECAVIVNHKNNCFSNVSGKLTNNAHECLSSYNFELNCDYEIESGCNVVVSSYFSTTKLFVRIIDEPWQELFNKLCNEVAFSGLSGKKFLPVPNKRKLCIAKYYEDNVYYRAEIKNIFWEQKKVEIIFVDFGNRQITKFEDLKCLPEYLKNIKTLAVEVDLKDTPKFSTPETIDYLNKLTAEEVPLVIKFDDLSKGVVLIEKDTNQTVNKKINDFSQPSWKKDESVLSKLGKVYFMESLKLQTLEVGKKYSLTISHFDEKEFLDSGVFWMNFTDSDNFYHVSAELREKITEYCEYLKNDSYLPRVNELCLAEENGNWHRCLNLKTHKTSCFLFFVDDGHSSIIKTNKIRKIVGDFIEFPSQGICCMLSGDTNLKEKEDVQSNIVKYLNNSSGKTIDNVFVNEFLGDAYRVVIPETTEFFKN